MDQTKLIYEIAGDLGVKAGARDKWLVRGYVPHRWRLPILQEAARRGVFIDPVRFEEFRRAAA